MNERFTESQLEGLAEMKKLNQAERAQAISELVHAQQKDKAGVEYIGHPRRVTSVAVRSMRALKDRFSELEIEMVRQASWLHDVLEDSGENGFPKVHASDLADWGIKDEVIEIVQIVTKTGAKVASIYDDPYFIGIKENHLARALKIADITDNHNLDRMELLQHLGIGSKNSHYRSVLRFLSLDREEWTLFYKRINLPPEVTEQEWVNALLEQDEIEPWGYTMSLEDHYYRNLNSGMKPNEAAKLAGQQVADAAVYLKFSNEGYSVRRALAKESEEWARRSRAQDSKDNQDKG